MDEPIEQDEQESPPVNFITFVAEQVTMAQLYLGGVHNPETEQVIVNLSLVKRIIDGLEVLQEKTRGNLIAPETNFLENSLYELRMSYVRAANRADEPQEDDAQTDTSQDETP